MLGPSGPRRLRLAVEHLAQFRGGICFCIDLDPRWVVKLIKKGWMEHLEAYKQHCIDQAITILGAGHDIKCMFTTPKLLEALAWRWKSAAPRSASHGHHRHLLRRHRVHAAVDPLRHRRVSGRRVHDAHLRQHADGPGLLQAGHGRRGNYKITYYAPQPRAVIEVVDFDDSDRVVGYGQTGRVKLTTLTKEFFVPGFPGARRRRTRKAVHQISLGRRQRRAAVPRAGRSHDGGSVLKDVRSVGVRDGIKDEMKRKVRDVELPGGPTTPCGPYRNRECHKINRHAWRDLTC